MPFMITNGYSPSNYECVQWGTGRVFFTNPWRLSAAAAPALSPLAIARLHLAQFASRALEPLRAVAQHITMVLLVARRVVREHRLRPGTRRRAKG